MISNEVAWLIVSVLFFIAEVLTGGFWMVFFGAAALAVSGLAWQGSVTGTNPQILVFLISSVISLLIFRAPLVGWLGRKTPHANIGDTTGQEVTVTVQIPQGGSGRVEFQGSTWNAQSVRGEAIEAGARVKIVREEGTRLVVDRQKSN